MEILYTSSQVKKAIKDLFADSKGRRVVITAFVGNDANTYLPKPKDIELICWPKAGGTNPNAVRDLIGRGVKVFFADAVHMKVYWASDKGAVITSANLSTNALGTGGLKEVGVLLPKGTIKIDKIIGSLSPRPVLELDLLRLDREHKAFFKKNPAIQIEKTSSLMTFDEWYHSEARTAWKLAGYQWGKFSLSRESKAVLEREHGSPTYKDIIYSPTRSYRIDDWLLCFNFNGNKVNRIGWMFAHHIVPKISPAKKSSLNRKSYQILQVNNLSWYDPRPFQIDKAFRTAFEKAVRDFGGIEKIDELSSPPKKLIELVYNYYVQEG